MVTGKTAPYFGTVCHPLTRHPEDWFITVAILLEKGNEIARVKMAMEREVQGQYRGKRVACSCRMGRPGP